MHYDNYNLHCVISIHALLAESDLNFWIFAMMSTRFLSTLSLRRATLLFLVLILFMLNFYPRSPCGERQYTASKCSHNSNFYPRSPCGERHNIPPDSVLIIDISIHALLAESDESGKQIGQSRSRFLSTLSLRRATMLQRCPLKRK